MATKESRNVIIQTREIHGGIVGSATDDGTLIADCIDVIQKGDNLTQISIIDDSGMSIATISLLGEKSDIVIWNAREVRLINTNESIKNLKITNQSSILNMKPKKIPIHIENN